jgi:hypothetical protein
MWIDKGEAALALSAVIKQTSEMRRHTMNFKIGTPARRLAESELKQMEDLRQKLIKFGG